MKNFAFSGRVVPAIKFNGRLFLVLTILLAGPVTSLTLAQAPTVSYSSPLNYTAGNTITPLSPASSGVAAPGYGSAPVTLMSSYSEPTGVAVDAAGNLYIADQADNEVKKFAAGSTTGVVIGTGFNAPSGVAVDAAGNVYVTDHGNNEVKKIPAGTTTPVVFATGFNQPYGVAVDAAGNVYVADSFNNAIKKIPVGGGAQVSIGTGFSGPLGVAVDVAGNVYVTDFGNNAVKEILAAGGTTATIGSGFNQPYGISVDAEGNVFVADAGNNEIKELRVTGGIPVVLGSGFVTPHGVTADGAGNVFVGDYGNNAIKEIKPVGGFYLNAVPPGLNFNNSTGTLSGTPASTGSATNYTVTAYNSTGSAQATINITVSPFVISYASPKTYTVGTIITPLSPGGSSVPSQINGGSPVPLSSGFPISPGLAVDAAGNIYVGNNAANIVVKIPAGGGAPVTIASFVAPEGLAVDAAGNVYVSGGMSGQVQKIPFSAGAYGAPVTLATGLGSSSAGIAIDAAGNVYVPNSGTSTIQEILAGGAVIAIGSGFKNPEAIAVDAAGNVYIADTNNNAIKMIPVAGGPVITLASGFNEPGGIAVDPSYDVYVSDSNNNTVDVIPAGSSTPLSIGNSFKFPQGLAIDATGKIYVCDVDNNAVKQISPTGGYFLNTALPQGLSFSNTSGNISGTPLMASAAANYTVTAYNAGGGTQATVNIKTVLPALPAISYSSLQTYTAGAAITPLAPAGSGVGAVAYSGFPSTVGSGFSMSPGVAVDASGNVYIGDEANSTIEKFPAGGGAMVPVITLPAPITGLAINAAGDIYESGGSNAVVKIAAGTGTPVTVASGFMSVAGIALDASGNLYIVDTGNGLVEKIPANGGSNTYYQSGLNGPTAVAADAAGNIYVADTGDNAIKEYTAGNFTPVTIASGFNAPAGIATDISGNLLIGDSRNNAIKIIPVGSSTPVIIGSDFLGPKGIAIGASGKAYISDAGHSLVKKIVPVGGYYISANLPQGLSFSNTTGIISGTPTVPGPAKNYSVTGYNYGGAAVAVVSIKTVNPPAVTISYASPQTYTTGVAIATLLPTSSNVSPLAYSGSPVVYTSGFPVSAGIAMDAAGNIYVVNNGPNELVKIPAGGGTPVNLASTSGTSGIAVDAAGNIYISVDNGGTIQKIPAGGSAVTVATGLGNPQGLALDAAGDIYVANSGSGSVEEILAGGGGTINLGSGFSNPQEIALDAAGNVYVADAGNNAIKMIPAAGGPVVTLGSGFSQPYGVAVDASGNVYVSDSNNNAVKMIPAGNGAPVSLGSGFKFPEGLVVDGTGKVYLVDASHNEVKQMVPIGGYYLNTALPAGLNFSNATGAISGTPALKSTAKNYTVTAYNIGSGKAATVNLSIAANANLSALKISSGALAPVFASNTTGYTAKVGNSITSITLTPTTSDPAATVKVNGATVAPGAASAAIPLAVGPNTITTVVTAQDGITTQAYTVAVTRAASAVAYLSNLKVTTAALSPAFAFKTFSYTSGVLNSTASITVTPTLLDTTATVKVNGVTVASKTASAPIALNAGPNTISVVATAQDGVTTQTYTITITRAPSTNASLAGLKLSTGTLAPAFTAATTSYTASVANSTASITVMPTTAVATATVTVNGTAVTSGTASAVITLNAGANTITTVVTAQDGVTIKTYTVTVTRAPSTDAYLSNLKVTTATLSPAFAFKTLGYTSSVPNTTSSVTVTPTLLDATASSLTVNGAAVANKAASGAIALAVGVNNINVTIIAQDGATSVTYTIAITRASGGMDSYSVSIPIAIGTREAPALFEDGILVHQGISPNGDGIDDFLQIDNISRYPDNKLSVMNRNGQLIYEAQGYDNSSKTFDGHNNKNGKMQLPGTYFYRLDYTVNGITKHKTGFIVLKY